MAFALPAVGTAAAAAGAGTAAAAGGTLLGTLGTAIGIGGSLFKGYTAMRAANYESSLAKMNAALAEQNALDAQERAQQEQLEQDNATAALYGEQLATQGASGLAVSGRSAVLTRKSAQRLGRKDALNIREAGDVQAYNYKTQAANFRAEAKAAKTRGKVAMISALFDAGSSLIGGATPVGKSMSFTPRPSARFRPLFAR